jgi:hypothetical protein
LNRAQVFCNQKKPLALIQENYTMSTKGTWSSQKLFLLSIVRMIINLMLSSRQVFS